MKICVISFDFWGYDAHITETLNKKGIQAHYIKIGEITHSNLIEKIKNAISKLILNKNLKHEKRQKHIVEQLKKIGKQDQILVLNCDTIEHKTLSEIKKYTDRMVTFLYDNLERYPVEDKLHYFDKIYAFDDQDVKKHKLEKITNYNYLQHQPNKNKKPQYDVLYITSFDKKRIKQLYLLTKIFKNMGIKYNVLVLGKKAWIYRIKEIIKNSGLTFRTKLIPHDKLIDYYQDTKIIIDLMRQGQYGLSFRVFEAMALEKKIITDNTTIQQYSFFDSNNILITNEDFSNVTKDFFNTEYQPLSPNIYHQYTIDAWVEKVFNIK